MEKCWCGNDHLEGYSEHYYKCSKCNTLISDVDFTEKILDVEDEEKDLYGKNYWEVLMKKLTGKNSLDEIIDYYLQERTIYWIKYLLKYKLPECSIAEIGGGCGQLAYLTKAVGYKQITFELSAEICRYARENLRVDMRQGEITQTNEKFDVVMSFDLLEHIINPREFIKKCLEHLKDDGIFCFQTPSYNPELSYENMKDKKPQFLTHLTEFQHVFLFSKESIKTLLKEQGLNYIVFEPAVFGDDYDMFVFASKLPLVENDEQKINECLNKMENGRLVKSMMSLYKDVVEKQHVIEELIQYKDYLERTNETLCGKK